MHKDNESHCISTLDNTLKKFNFYFPSLNTHEYDWVRNPFVESSSNTGLLLCEEEELACISSDRGLKIKHVEVPIDTFWIAVKEYPSLAKKALTIMMPFLTLYLCELAFSTLQNIKSKKRERLCYIEEKMRVCLSEIHPNIKTVAKKHQAHVSH